MTVIDILGARAHPGGVLVDRPELRVGVVRAVSRLSGLELELIARRPLDQRDALTRQADIRAGRGGVRPAERRLLPAHDEGMDLRVGWLDPDGTAHWEFGSHTSWSGDHYLGENGPFMETTVQFPPHFGRVTVALAWPEIGFPETVVELPVPDRDTVARHTVPIWAAPTDDSAVPDGLTHGIADDPPGAEAGDPPVDVGLVVAGPRVLVRTDTAAVVLNRLTDLGPALSLELASIARGEAARAISDAVEDGFGTHFLSGETPEQIRDGGVGASIAVIRGREALWVRHTGATAHGGPDSYVDRRTFVIARPVGGVVDLIVAWPRTGLPDRRVSVRPDGH